jgi:ribonucleoside-diphosphate reductase alpha chain
VIGKGDDQSRPQGGAASASSRFVSRGFVRSKTDKLMLVQGSFEVASPAGLVTDGATALKQSPATYRDELTAATSAEFEQLEWSAPASAPKPTAADKRAEARMKGYVGEACPECANFTMVRNGTCLKCDTCGSTTGCS